MRFLWPDLLWLMLLVPILVAAYIHVLRRRKKEKLHLKDRIRVLEDRLLPDIIA